MSPLKFLPDKFLRQSISNEMPKKAKILTVEPDPALAEFLGLLFDHQDYDYKIIPRTDDIRPLATNFEPDLILIEYLLPDVNGGELCTQIKEDSRLANTPVILCSAYPQLLWSVKDYGCDGFVGKPFDLDHLLSKIKRLILQSKRRKEKLIRKPRQRIKAGLPFFKEICIWPNSLV